MKSYIVVIFVMLLVAAMLLSPTIAGADEVRTAFLTKFNLSESTFILTDEDGYSWEFALEEANYTVGDEYTLHLPDDGDPWYEEPIPQAKDIIIIGFGGLICIIAFAAIFYVAASVDR